MDGENGMMNFGWGGEWMFFLVILFLFQNNGFGFGGNGNQQGAVNQEILSNQHFNALESRIDDIGKGICDSTYALNNSIKDCCCNTQLGIANLMAAGDRNTCAITTAIHAEADATRDLIRQNEITALRDKVADLQLAQSQAVQNAYLVNALKPPCPIPAYLTCSPYEVVKPA